MKMNQKITKMCIAATICFSLNREKMQGYTKCGPIGLTNFDFLT